MTKPLINKNMLRNVLWREAIIDGHARKDNVLQHVERNTNAVLEYLQTVLTPSTLSPPPQWYEPYEVRITGEKLYERLFGKDCE